MSEEPLDGGFENLARRLGLLQCKCLDYELANELVIKVSQNILALQIEHSITECKVHEELALLLGDTGAGEHGALNVHEPVLKKLGFAIVRVKVASGDSKLNDRVWVSKRVAEEDHKSTDRDSDGLAINDNRDLVYRAK